MTLFAYHLDDPKNTNETFETELEFVGWSYLTDLERWEFSIICENCSVQAFGTVDDIIRIWERVQGVADEEARALGVNKRRARLSSV